MDNLNEILSAHSLWLADGNGGQRADLSYANLRDTDLSSTNLSHADLSDTDLSYADLSHANLSYANLSDTDLSYANLRDANLSYANLSSTDLSDADLSNINLSCANLRGANLTGANLTDAELPAPPMVLLAAWGALSEDLCLELMRYDAANHPEPEAFEKWVADGGPCPYSHMRIQRAANFTERRDLYTPGPSKSALELMVRVIREKCAASSYHK